MLVIELVFLSRQKINLQFVLADAKDSVIVDEESHIRELDVEHFESIVRIGKKIIDQCWTFCCENMTKNVC